MGPPEVVQAAGLLRPGRPHRDAARLPHAGVGGPCREYLPVELGTAFVTSITFDGYRKIRQALDEGGSPNVRVTYSRGRLELMAPSHRHEKRKSVLSMFLETLMLEWGVEFEAAGSTTFEREDLDQGFEPDEGYWITQVERLDPERGYDPDRDPPHELVLEVEVTRSAVKRMPLYERMQIPEVWRYTRLRKVEVYVLTPGGYDRRDRSPSFPDLDLAVLEEHLARSDGQRASVSLRAWRDWLRKTTSGKRND